MKAYFFSKCFVSGFPVKASSELVLSQKVRMETKGIETRELLKQSLIYFHEDETWIPRGYKPSFLPGQTHTLHPC